MKRGITSRIVVLAVALVVSLHNGGCRWLDPPPESRASDSAFILLENIPSPDGLFRLLVYQYDTGAFGYSRVYWAVTPSRYEDLNLDQYELPDGYKAEGWSQDGKLLVKKWEPYYYKDEEVELKTGDTFQGVQLVVVSSEVGQPRKVRR